MMCAPPGAVLRLIAVTLRNAVFGSSVLLLFCPYLRMFTLSPSQQDCVLLKDTFICAIFLRTA